MSGTGKYTEGWIFADFVGSPTASGIVYYDGAPYEVTVTGASLGIYVEYAGYIKFKGTPEQLAGSSLGLEAGLGLGAGVSFWPGSPAEGKASISLGLALTYSQTNVRPLPENSWLEGGPQMDRLTPEQKSVLQVNLGKEVYDGVFGMLAKINPAVAQMIVRPQCFPSGTLVARASGEAVPIESLRVGDEVLAFDPDTSSGRGQLLPKRIVRLFENVTTEWIALSNGLVVTPGHHFLDADGAFRPIVDIINSDGRIILQSGAVEAISGAVIQYSDATAHLFEQAAHYRTATAGNLAVASPLSYGWRTYNIEVADLHTYIAGGVRVHNESVYTASGSDITVGEYTNINGDRLRVNSDGSISNLTTGKTTASASQIKYTSAAELELLVGNISPSKQYEKANENVFGRTLTPGSGPLVTLASGAVAPVGTKFTTGDGYRYIVNENGSVTNQDTGRISGNGTRQYNPDTNSWEIVTAPLTGAEAIARANQNSAAAAAIANGKKTYTTSSNMLMPTVAMNGNTRNTYGDSPVLLDLDGDGIEITELGSSNVFFDTVGDGKLHRAAWAGAGDGMLVRDAGNDGVINLRSEIDFTQWDPTAKGDMQALLHVFDTNHDGKLSSADADWSLFKVMVTNPDGTTTLKTLAELGITEINLISNNQEISLPDGSKVLGTTTFTRSDGSTGTAADTKLAYDVNGYVISKTVTHNGDGSTTIVNRATNPDGSLAQQTTTTTSADGKSRTIQFDTDGDGVLDRVQTDVTVNNGDGSVSQTIQNFDGSQTILSNKEVRLTSADGKTITVSRDVDGSGNYDELETRVTGADGSLTVTTTHLNADGSTKDERTTITSADGLSKTIQVELTGSGAINASRVEGTLVAGDGTRTETVTNYAGNGTSSTNKVGQDVTVTSADGSSKSVTRDLDGNGSTDLVTSSTIVRNGDGSTTTTESQYNGDTSLRSQTVTDLSADGLSKTTKVDADGNGSYDQTVVDVTVINGDGSTTATITEKASNGATLAQTVSTWSADGTTRTTSVDTDGDGNTDQTEAVALVSGNSVKTTSIYSPNGATLVSKAVSTTSNNGLTQTTQVDANGDGTYDRTSSSTVVINGDGSSTVTTISKNGDGTVQIGKSVATTSADGLSTTTQYFLGTATSAYKTETDVTVKNGNGSITETATSFEGTSQVQTGKVITTLSADRLTTTVSSYLNTNASPEQVVSIVTNADGSKTQTTSNYSPNGATLLSKAVAVISSEGLTTTTTVDANGNAVTDGATVAAKTLNSDGTTTITITEYQGSGTASTNKVGATVVDVSANGLITTTQVDANGDGTYDQKQVDGTVLNADGSKTRTVTAYNGAGGIQTGKVVTTVSDDGLTSSKSTYLGTHTTADKVETDSVVLAADGSKTETMSVFSSSGALTSRAIATTAGNGLSANIATDLDGNGVNDLVVATTTNADGSRTTVSSVYSSTGVLTSRSTETVSASGLSKTIATDNNGNGTTDLSSSDVLVLNADGSRTETLSNFTGTSALKDKTVITTSADGLSKTTQWYNSGSSLSATLTDVTTIAADGTTTQVISRLNANASLHDKTTIVTGADDQTVTTTKDIDGNGTVDQTVVQTAKADGSALTSNMDGTVQSASGRLYGSASGRYETVSADGLSTTVRYDANGNGLAESQTTEVISLNADGSRVLTVTDSTLSGGVASSADPIYTVTLKDKAVTTVSADGLSTTKQFDLTGSGSFGTSQTDVTVLNADGSETETFSDFVGATLKSRYAVTTSADGLSVTTQWDTAGTGTYTQTSTDVTALNASGSTTETVTSTGGGGALISKVVTTVSGDGRTTTIQSDLDGSGSFEGTRTITKTTLSDGSTTTVNSNVSGIFKDIVTTKVSADGRIVTTDYQNDGVGSRDQSEVVTLLADGSSTKVVTDNQGSAVLAKLTTTASADGLLVTSLRDLEGNGINDRSTTRTNYERADGSTGSTLQIYKISDYVNGSQTAIAAVLLQTVTTTVSADGNTATTAVDVDGNGSVDETSTTVTKIDGSSVTTTTDNAAARAVDLSSGDAHWISAIAIGETIAASTTTTVSSDQLTRTVLADYDGNGTNEHEETWITRVDGVQIGTIVDKNASGTVVQSGTETISADGQTVTLLTDYNNDGIVDKKEVSYTSTSGFKTKSTTDYNASGSAIQTIVTTVSAVGEKVTYKGTGAAETLTGTNGDETLVGGAGADTLVGGGGMDRLYGGAGIDTASYAGATAGVVVNLGNSAANTGDAAGDQYDLIENLIGSAFNDTLTARQNGLRTEYFNLTSINDVVDTVDWNAAPVYVAADGYANWNRGEDDVYPGRADSVAVRMTGQFTVSTSGTYTFYGAADDCCRIYIDGVPIINFDYDSPGTGYAQANATLAAGTHQIEIRYVEGIVGAFLKLEWSGPSLSRRLFEGTTASPNAPAPGLLANYFSAGSATSLGAVNWAADPIHTEAWATIQKNFGTGAIYSGGPSDQVAIRLTGSVNVSTAGTYTFYATSDDGAQIYVDGTLVVNNDGVHTVSTASATVSLSAGSHDIEIRYFDKSGAAELTVEWSGPGLTRQVLSSTDTSYVPPGAPPAEIWGGGGNDVITGGRADDTLWGQTGTDTLSGGDGDDRLIGGAGADSLTGGNGTDTASYEDATSGVTVNLGSMGSNTGDAAGDTYSSIEAVSGSNYADTLTASSSTAATLYGAGGNDNLTGGSAVDHLYGGLGNDTLNGGSGDDFMFGEGGDDIYVVGSTSDSVAEDANNGTDLVQASVTYTLGANVENLTLTGSSSLSGTGNSLANTITGNSGANTLTGNAGNDTLSGGGGVDTLIGGLGADDLYGGSSNDIFEYLTTDDSVTGSRDRIMDFATGDKVKVSAIDADTGTTGDQAFVLDTNASFSAGEIRQTVVGSDLLIEFNVDADSTPEMSVLIVGRTAALSASDFTL